MASPLYRAWTKAILTDGSAPGYSASWMTARRGWLNVYDDRLECGDIIIPIEGIEGALLYEARQWFIPVYILTVTTPEGTYQFGLNPWTKIAAHLPFPYRRERVRLQYSSFSSLLRVALIAYVVYLLYQRFLDA
jgi:hypothetical protein